MLQTQWVIGRGGCFKYEISILPSSYIQISVDGELLVWWACVSLYAICFVFFFFFFESFETFEKVWKNPELQKLNAFSCLDKSFDLPIISVILEKKS